MKRWWPCITLSYCPRTPSLSLAPSDNAVCCCFLESGMCVTLTTLLQSSSNVMIYMRMKKVFRASWKLAKLEQKVHQLSLQNKEIRCILPIHHARTPFLIRIAVLVASITYSSHSTYGVNFLEHWKSTIFSQNNSAGCVLERKYLVIPCSLWPVHYHVGSYVCRAQWI